MTTSPNPVEQTTLRVLLVEDCRLDVDRCVSELTRCDFILQWEVAATQAEVGERLDSAEYDVVICDHALPGCTGWDVLQRVRTSCPSVPVIILGDIAQEEETHAIEVIQKGGVDFVRKDQLWQLRVAVYRALREKRLREACKRAEQAREELDATLRERVREVSCLYSISSIIQSTADRDKMLRRIADRIPAGWAHPEIARARLRLDGIDYVSSKFQESELRQSADLLVCGAKRGQVEVF